MKHNLLPLYTPFLPPDRRHAECELRSGVMPTSVALLRPFAGRSDRDRGAPRRDSSPLVAAGPDGRNTPSGTGLADPGHISLGTRRPLYRGYLIDAAANGRKWTAKGSRKKLTDREMVDLANRLHGWTESVYRFGCGLIHLSNMHDYRTRDPLRHLPDDERNAVIEHLRSYHGGPARRRRHSKTSSRSFLVYSRRFGHPRCYLRQLENDGDLDV